MISVIVLTSPGREKNLTHCLENLKQQRFSDFEVWVVDDGSTGGQDVITKINAPYPLFYTWRPNDMSPARSRNLGAKKSKGDDLVFIDGDILLNPNALAAYRHFLNQCPDALLVGYFGNTPASSAPSIFVSDQFVHWHDNRFYGLSPDQSYPVRQLFHIPQYFVWSGNLAISRSAFEAIGGFSEGFIGWGGEDTEFGERMLDSGREIHFVLDSWGEHQCHEKNESFHEIGQSPITKQSPPHQYKPASYSVQVLSTPQGQKNLFDTIKQHYLKYERNRQIHTQLVERYASSPPQIEISLIISNEPNKENNLRYALSVLQQQSHRNFEVIVVDNGSINGYTVVEEAKVRFPIRYTWRPNDNYPARSRNLGAQEAQGEYLVFMDPDLILNPNALNAYQAYLSEFPNALFYGYVGYDSEQQAPSYFFPELKVAWYDHRFMAPVTKTISPRQALSIRPWAWAWSGNFAITAAGYQQLKGFNEQILDRRNEDADFACRALENGYEIHYCLDTWAEYQLHPHTPPVYLQDLNPNTLPQNTSKSPEYHAQTYFHRQVYDNFLHIINTHYLAQNT